MDKIKDAILKQNALDLHFFLYEKKPTKNELYDYLYFAFEKEVHLSIVSILRYGKNISKFTSYSSIVRLMCQTVKENNSFLLRIVFPYYKNFTNNEWHEALHYASQYYSMDIVDFLFAQGVDVNARTRFSGTTALMEATSYDAMVHLLLNGADPRIRSLKGMNSFDRHKKNGMLHLLMEALSSVDPLLYQKYKMRVEV